MKLDSALLLWTMWGWFGVMGHENCTKAVRVHYSRTVKVQGDRCRETCREEGLTEWEIAKDLEKICHFKPCLDYFQLSIDIYPNICPHIANFSKAMRQKNLDTCAESYCEWNGAERGAEDCTKAVRAQYWRKISGTWDRCLQTCQDEGLSDSEIATDVKHICHFKPCVEYFQLAVEEYPDVCPHVDTFPKARRERDRDICVDAYEKWWNGAVSWHSSIVLSLLIGPYLL